MEEQDQTNDKGQGQPPGDAGRGTKKGGQAPHQDQEEDKVQEDQVRINIK